MLSLYISEEKHSLVFQLVRPDAEASDNGKKLKKANTVICPGLWPPAICPLFTKNETVTLRLCSIGIKTQAVR